MRAATTHASEDNLAPGPSIGAVRGAATADIQKLLAGFAERRRREGLRVAGAVEVTAPAGAPFCGRLALQDLSSGALFPVTVDLGPGSRACKLDAAGLTAACQSVLHAISQGAGLAVLSKFGKVEAEGGGFLDAFSAAAAAGIPCITGVAPSFAAAFLDYAGGYSQWIGAEPEPLERWWTSRLGRGEVKAAK